MPEFLENAAAFGFNRFRVPLFFFAPIDGGEAFFELRADVVFLEIGKLTGFEEQIGFARFRVLDIEGLARMACEGGSLFGALAADGRMS